MAEALPVLSPPEEKKISVCPGRTLCDACPLFTGNGGPCSGCTDTYRERCAQGRCFSRCNRCGGGLHAIVVAACGHSPLRDVWAKVVLRPLQPYRPRPVSIATPLIPVIYGQKDARRIPRHFPQIDAWAVPVHKAMNITGRFRSDDMKDYLGLSKGQKLILSTAGPDDFMEMLWARGDTYNYQKQGFDYWFPVHFSVYDNDSKFYQFFNARRQQMHARMVKSQFVWLRLGEHIPLSWLEPIRGCRAVLISCQQMYSSFNRQLLAREVAIADKAFPSSTSFYLLGSGQHVVTRQDRKIYELHSHWLIAGLKGVDLKGVARMNLNRGQLLCKNLKDLYENVTIRRPHTPH